MLVLLQLDRAVERGRSLFTVLICIPCLEVRQAQPDTLLGFHDPAGPQIKQSLVG